jgi:Xaa-Pro dipeptidase
MRVAFPESEYRERLTRARAALRGAGFDGYVAIAPEHLYYLSGFDSHTYWTDQACVFTVADDVPTLVIRDTEEGGAAETAWTPDVRSYHFPSDDSLGFIASVVKEKGLGGKRIAADLRTFALSMARGQQLLDKLGFATVEDGTALIAALRVVKSAAELAYVRQAARYANAGMEAVFRAARPGRSETAVAAEIEYAVRSGGSDSSAMPTWMSSGERTAYSHLTPTERVLRPGDLLSCAFAGVARRYHCSMYRTVALGEPSRRVREVYEAAREAVEAGAREARPGVRATVLEEAAVEPLRRQGLDKYFAQRFGYGVSAGYPPTWMEPLDIVRGSEQRLAAGMVFCLHCVLKLPEERFGVLVGGDYILTDDGVEFLDRSGLELRVLG